MYITQQLLDLEVLAAATEDQEGLRAILREGHDLYVQGLAETTAAVQTRYAKAPDARLEEALHHSGVPPVSSDRQSRIRTLAFHEWERTPAAMAYSGIAEQAARRGVSLIPE